MGCHSIQQKVLKLIYEKGTNDMLTICPIYHGTNQKSYHEVEGGKYLMMIWRYLHILASKPETNIKGTRPTYRNTRCIQNVKKVKICQLDVMIQPTEAT